MLSPWELMGYRGRVGWVGARMTTINLAGILVHLSQKVGRMREERGKVSKDQEGQARITKFGQASSVAGSYWSCGLKTCPRSL